MGWIKDKVRHGLAKRGIENTNAPHSISAKDTMHLKVFAYSGRADDNDLKRYVKTIEGLHNFSGSTGTHKYVFQFKREISPEDRKMLETMYTSITFAPNGKTMSIVITNKKAGGKYLTDKQFRCLFNEVQSLKVGEYKEIKGRLTAEQGKWLNEAYPSLLVNSSMMYKVAQEKPKINPFDKNKCKVSGKIKSVEQSLPIPKPPKIKQSSNLGDKHVTPLYNIFADGKDIEISGLDIWDLQIVQPSKKDIKVFGLIKPIKRAGKVQYYNGHITSYKDSYIFDLLDAWVLSKAGWVIVEKGKHNATLFAPTVTKSSLMTSKNKTTIKLTYPVTIKDKFYGINVESDYDESDDDYGLQKLVNAGDYKFRKYGKNLFFIPANKKWSDTKEIRYMTEKMVKSRTFDIRRLPKDAKIVDI